MNYLGTVRGVEPLKPKHDIRFLSELGVYGCSQCGPLYAQDGETDLRAVAARHCHENGLCGACWGVGSWIFVSSPICTQPCCSKCGGYGTREAELDPNVTWIYPTRRPSYWAR